MSKKKRTKREKIIADLRKKLSQTKDAAQRTSPISTMNLEKYDHSTPVSKHIPYVFLQKEKVQKDYSYVLSDMKRTGGIVSVIVLANLLFAFLLKKNIVSIKLLGL